MISRVLVTGGAGFIGSHVVDRLVRAGYETIVVDDLSTGLRSNVNSHAQFYQLNILDANLRGILLSECPDAVVHMAAQVDAARSVSAPLFDANINVVGSLRLLAACQRVSVSSFVHASSAAIYGNPETLPVSEDHPHRPLSPYGMHKDLVGRYLDFYHHEDGLNYSNLCFANVYGPRQGAAGEGAVVPAFVTRILDGEPLIIFGDGSQTRDFVYVDDVARAVVEALENPVNQTVNISTGEATSIAALAHIISDLACQPLRVTEAPPRPGDIQHSTLSNARARELLGWEQRMSLRHGLLRTMAYMVSRMEVEGFRRQAIMSALDDIDQAMEEDAADTEPVYELRRRDIPSGFGAR